MAETPDRWWRRRRWFRTLLLATAPVSLPVMVLAAIALWPGLTVTWRMGGWRLIRLHNGTGFDRLELGHRERIEAFWERNESWDVWNRTRGFHYEEGAGWLGFLPTNASLNWENKLRSHRVGVRWFFENR